MSEEKQVRKAWGTDAEYYAELESFHKQHERADTLVYHTESKLLIKAEYYFRPVQVYEEGIALRAAIRAACKEEFGGDE